MILPLWWLPVDRNPEVKSLVCPAEYLQNLYLYTGFSCGLLLKLFNTLYLDRHNVNMTPVKIFMLTSYMLRPVASAGPG